MPRLMALCELYTSKKVERATVRSIAEADVDVVGENNALLHLNLELPLIKRLRELLGLQNVWFLL